MICPQFYDAMCFSQWPYKWWHPKNDFILVAWVSCGGHFKHNHHLPWHWPLVVAVQEKQSHDLLLLMLWWWPWNVESNDFFRAKRDIRTGMDFSQRCCHSSFPIFRFNVKTREDLTCTRISKAKTRDFSAAAGRRTENQTFRRIFPGLSAFLRKSFEWIWFGDTFFEWLTATDVVQWQSGENSNFSPNEQFGK